MVNKTDSPRYSDYDSVQAAWEQGYGDGFHNMSMEGKENPFVWGTLRWEAYEDGYEEGWLDS